jgi:hypothetical protein
VSHAVGMIDEQLTAYDDFNEPASEVFRIFDDGDQELTARPSSPGLQLAPTVTLMLSGNRVGADAPVSIGASDTLKIA